MNTHYYGAWALCAWQSAARLLTRQRGSFEARAHSHARRAHLAHDGHALDGHAFMGKETAPCLRRRRAWRRSGRAARPCWRWSLRARRAPTSAGCSRSRWLSANSPTTPSTRCRRPRSASRRCSRSSGRPARRLAPARTRTGRCSARPERASNPRDTICIASLRGTCRTAVPRRGMAPAACMALCNGRNDPALIRAPAGRRRAARHPVRHRISQLQLLAGAAGGQPGRRGCARGARADPGAAGPSRGRHPRSRIHHSGALCGSRIGLLSNFRVIRSAGRHG